MGLIQCNNINQNLNITYCGFLNIFTQYSLAGTIHCEPCNTCYVKFICFYNCTAYVGGLLCGRSQQVKSAIIDNINSLYCNPGHLHLFSATNYFKFANSNSSSVKGWTAGFHFHPFIDDGTSFNYHQIKNSISGEIIRNNGTPIIIRLRFISIVNNTVSWVFRSDISATQYLTDVRIIKYHPIIFYGTNTLYLTRFYLDLSFIGYSIPTNCIITNEFSFEDPIGFNINLCRLYEDQNFQTFTKIEKIHFLFISIFFIE